MWIGQKNIDLITNETNLGYGGSIKKAIKHTKKEFAIWVPGDNAHKEKELATSIDRYIKHKQTIVKYLIIINKN